MSNELNDIIKEYVLKNPTKSFSELAILMIEDGVTNKSFGTLRQYAGKIKSELELAQDQINDLKEQIASNNELIEELADKLLELEATTTSSDTLDEVEVKPVPKILILDIETARMQFGAWSIGKQYLGPDQIIKDWFILGFSAKWLGSDTIMSSFVTSQEAIDRTDARVCGDLWPLLNEANIVITHNGNKFDLPKINSRFLLNNYLPPMPYESLDTYRVVSKQFGFASNSLNYLSKVINSEEKIKTLYSLWISCEAGDAQALKDMETYCIGDVELLEDLYMQLRPWIHSHSNLAVLMDSDVQTCPNCGGTSFTEEEGQYTTPQNKFPAVRCDTCGAINRKKTSKVTTERRKVMLVPIAR